MKGNGNVYQYYYTCIAMSGDGKKIVFGRETHYKYEKLGNTVVLYDMNNESEIFLEGHENVITCVDISYDGHIVVSGSEDSTIRVWDVRSRKAIILQGHSDAITSLCLCPRNSQTLISASQDSTVFIWDVSRGTSENFCHSCEDYMGPVSSLHMSMDGRTLATGYGQYSDYTVRVWDIESRKALTFNCHRNAVKSVHFSIDGKILASCSDDKNICLIEIASNKVYVLKGHTSSINKVYFSTDGTTLASCSDDRTVRVWDVDLENMAMYEESDEVQKSNEDDVKSVCLTNEGRRVVFLQYSQILIWNLEKGSLDFIHDWHHNSKYKVSSIFLSENGKFLVMSKCDKYDKEHENNIVAVKNFESGKEIELYGHTSQIACIGISENGKIVASGCKHILPTSDNTIYIWNLESGENLEFTCGDCGVSCLKLSADGLHLVVGEYGGIIHTGDLSVWLLNVKTHKMDLLYTHESSICCVDISGDGNIVVSSSSDKTIKVRNILTRKFTVLTGHMQSVTSICLTRDCKSVVSSSYADQTLRIWDIESQSQHTIIYIDSCINSISVQYDLGLIAIGSNEGPIQLWKRIDDTGQNWQLFRVLNSVNSVLRLGGSNVRDSIGLSIQNQQLFKQRKAIVSNSFFRKRGLRLAKLDGFRDSISYLDEALRLDPSDGVIYRIRGYCKYLLGDNTDLTPDFKKSFQLDPSFANDIQKYFETELDHNGDTIISFNQKVCEAISETFYGSGVRKMKSDLYHEAILDFDIATRFILSDTSALEKRVECYIKVGILDKAISDLDQIIQINPKKAKCFAWRGSLKFSLQQYQEAIPDFDVAILFEFDLVYTYHFRANCKFELGRYEEAIKDYDEVIHLDPENEVGQVAAEFGKMAALSSRQICKEKLTYIGEQDIESDGELKNSRKLI